jgi:hypothetical protein
MLVRLSVVWFETVVPKQSVNVRRASTNFRSSARRLRERRTTLGLFCGGGNSLLGYFNVTP